MSLLLHEVSTFKAGSIACFLHNWEELTTDNFIINIVKHGLALDFIQLPEQESHRPCRLTQLELESIDLEIEKLLSKKVIVPTVSEPEQFISNLFTRPKKDGSRRMILNLKKLNENIYYNHFKMDSIQNVMDAMKPLCFMASVDLKDAFYSVPILSEHSKYLKFYHRGKLYKFVVMPMGYGPAMRIFTKVSKVPFSELRTTGHISVVYVDDSYLQGDTYDDCMNNVIATINILRSLGYTVHAEKSVLIPRQHITFLGFEFNSISMTITLTLEKKNKIRQLALDILSASTISIRKVAKLLGNFTAAFPAVPFGRLHYRNIEREKIKALKISKGNFDGLCLIGPEAREDLRWWIDNVISASKPIKEPEIDLTLYTDASKKGWGVTDELTSTGGLWSATESDNYINWLELKAIDIGLKTYCRTATLHHVRVYSDNTTAIAYINNMGGMQSVACDTLAKDIWSWGCQRGFWISAAFIPGKENTVADSSSRVFNEYKNSLFNSPGLFEESTLLVSFSKYFFKLCGSKSML